MPVSSFKHKQNIQQKNGGLKESAVKPLQGGEFMSSLNIQITDMAGAYIEHSMVISNFLIKVGSQMQDNLCRIFGDNVQYKWEVNGEEKTVIPDASINCRFRNRRGNSFFNNPRFVLEVLSPST